MSTAPARWAYRTTAVTPERLEEVDEAPRVSWRLGYLEPAPIGTCS